MNYKEQLLIEVKCSVIYYFEVMESCKSHEDEELEYLRFTKFLNRLIDKYDNLEGKNGEV